MEKRHPAIPATIQPEQIETWLRNACKDSFDDESKHVYSEEELNEFARESSRKGGELIDLKKIADEVTAAIKKGTDKGIVIDIPATDGSEFITTSRQALDNKVKNGYDLIKRKIYGIPYDETNEMIYFDAVGNVVEDRCRPLSAKEQNEWFGMFAKMPKTGTNS